MFGGSFPPARTSPLSGPKELDVPATEFVKSKQPSMPVGMVGFQSRQLLGLRSRKPQIDVLGGGREKTKTRHRRNKTRRHRSSRTSNDAAFKLPSDDDWTATGQLDRANAVKDAMLHGWSNYKQYAWGTDELVPSEKKGKDWMGLGATIVDSLDTLYIMGLMEEYQEARDWIANDLDFDSTKLKHISTFETTIRSLGGMLSAYGLTGDRMYIQRSKDLGSRLLKAFNGNDLMPMGTVDLKSGEAKPIGWASGKAILSEVGTLQMEFFYLAVIAEDPKYAEKVLKVFDHLDAQEKPNGLYSIYVNMKNGHMKHGRVTLGALGDSYYEYLMKMYLLTNKQIPKYKRMYNEAIDAVDEFMIAEDRDSNMYIAEVRSPNKPDKIPKMDHLVCFAGGMYALGAHHHIEGDESTRLKHLRQGAAITETCYKGYHQMPTGIAPEIMDFTTTLAPKAGAKHYLLRPETVESLFVLWRITGEEKYREWGWEIFQSIERYCRHPNGYMGLRDVTSTSSAPDTVQQSFFFAETLKYLYLLFAPTNVISLDEWVFNTEAHPLPILKEPYSSWSRFHAANTE